MSAKGIDGLDQCVIFRGCLGRDAEMVGAETTEVGGIADEHPMFLDKVFLKGDGMDLLYFAKHEIGLRRVYADTGNFTKLLIQTLCLMQVGLAHQLIVLKQVFTRLDGES